MATKRDLGEPKWLGYVMACGLPAAMLGGFATTDQVLAHPGLTPNLVVPALLICGLNAWVLAHHPGRTTAATLIGFTMAEAVIIDSLALLAFEYGEPSVTHLLTGNQRHPIGLLINVNFPDVDPDAVQGVRVAVQGVRKIGDTLLERTDPRGEPYLWIGALREDTNPGEGTDLAAVAAGFVAVTPVHLDMTHHTSVAALRHRFGQD